MNSTRKKTKWIMLSLLVSISCCAELTLPTIFSDHMVLQQKQTVPVWGESDPNTTITVEFAGQQKITTAAADGKWRVDLDPMPASSKPRKLHVSNFEFQVAFSDVLVGEVWLCSGQSNMEMPLKGFFGKATASAARDIPEANIPLMRFYKSPKLAAVVPRDRIDAAWTHCTPETATEFSAAAFYFGRKLLNDLDVPVGLVMSAWGGTRIEPWTPPCGFEGIDSLSSLYEQVQQPIQLREKIPQHTPTALYNGMLAAHIPFAIKGAIWYQGETGHHEGMLYVDKSKALVNGWRKLWGYDFPFYFVQIAPFNYRNEDPEVLPVFWEAQSEIVKQIPGAAMAVINDYATLDDIHPSNKEVPGERLALLAEAKTYDLDVVCSGPTFKIMKKPLVGDRTLEIIFDFAEGLTTRDGKAPDWFEIGGEEGIFKRANAEIKGNRIILSSPDVPHPQAMRFAWHKLAMPNLVNGAGLPASAFRAGELPEPKLPAMVDLLAMKGYQVVYQLNVPANADYSTVAPEYEIDQSSEDIAFTKVAYLLEIQELGKAVQYAFASMDAFTDDLKKTGIPTAQNKVEFMQKVRNLTVRSNVNGIIVCTDFDGGNIEFCPGDYTQKNPRSLPGADAKRFDFGDTSRNKIPGYGCMQVHNWKDQQTVFAINRCAGHGTVDVGIGNSETAKASDWTFAGNAGDYFMRRLTVLVK